METEQGQQLLRALGAPEDEAKSSKDTAPVPPDEPLPETRMRPRRARATDPSRDVVTEAQAEAAPPFSRLSVGECEHLDATLRSQRQATVEMQGALDAFRKDRRRQAQAEDPLELLEWKLPKDDAPTRPEVRAVLEIKRSRKESTLRPTSAPLSAKTSQILAQYDESGSEDEKGSKKSAQCSLALFFSLRAQSQVVLGQVS